MSIWQSEMLCLIASGKVAREGERETSISKIIVKQPNQERGSTRIEIDCGLRTKETIALFYILPFC